MAADNISGHQEPEEVAQEAEKPLPNGYRQGVITAISVILGFSLYFVRFWALEAAGDWTLMSFLASVPTFLSIACLSIALWRSLQVADDNERVYRRTLQWFLWGVVFSLLGVLTASVSSTYASDESTDAKVGLLQKASVTGKAMINLGDAAGPD
ncbi:hypothetical protein [Mesorhizobium sp. ANAO-SY3R2]|uniref:hypothetical protein n=1 Tax=Mesorhizobium sp. ANAO-SY3R2 TaxID=3166644 RepID=UPI00366FDA9C